MSLGHRTYIIEGDSIRPLAQKTFDDFFFNERPTLGAYSGRTLTFAMPMYELENRRPARVVRFDTLRLAVRKRWLADRDHYRRRSGHFRSHRCRGSGRSGGGKEAQVSADLGRSPQENPGSPEHSVVMHRNEWAGMGLLALIGGAIGFVVLSTTGAAIGALVGIVAYTVAGYM
jgi:hypothetical protein